MQASAAPADSAAHPIDADPTAHARATGLAPADPAIHQLLDDAVTWHKFSQPLSQTSTALRYLPSGARPQDYWESHLVFEGMSCAACGFTLEKVLREQPGVVAAHVNAVSQRGSVIWHKEQGRPSDWLNAVAKSGYRALPAHDTWAQRQRREDSRRMLWRWLVAGFCMMQVMMYAWPEYTSNRTDIGREWLHLLRWASWLISLPVLLFSCRPFFAGALRDLRLRRIGMDVPVALGMLMTFVVSSIGAFTTDSQSVFAQAVFFDSFTMFVFFLLSGRWLELRLRERTAGSLDALMNRLPESVERLQPNAPPPAQSDAPSDIQSAPQPQTWERISVHSLHSGDIVRVPAGAAFAADGVLLTGFTQVDEALLTGESRAVPKRAGDSVFAGSHNLQHSVRLRVTALGEATRFADVVRLMERASIDKPQLVAQIDTLARPFLWAVLLAAVAALVWHWPSSPAHALMVAASILIVTCPCALALAAPAAMLASAGALARRGILLQRLQALESLAQAQHFVFDKTGTLTEEGLRLQRIVLAGPDTGVGADTSTSTSTSNNASARARIATNEYSPDAAQSAALRLAAALAAHSLHPLSRALVSAAQGLVGTATPPPHWDSVQELASQGLEARNANGIWRLGHVRFCGLDPAEFADTGLPEVHLCGPQGHIASFYCDETLRSDALATVQTLGQQGRRVWLLSGDRNSAVHTIAARLHLPATHVFSQHSPDEKLSRLRLIGSSTQPSDQVVMIGDGLNDGPVLAGASTSFALGQALPLSKARADIVLPGHGLSDVVLTWRWAKRTLSIVRQNLLWALLYNVSMVPLAALGWINAWQAGLGMALSSLLVICNALRLSRIPPQ